MNALTVKCSTAKHVAETKPSLGSIKSKPNAVSFGSIAPQINMTRTAQLRASKLASSIQSSTSKKETSLANLNQSIQSTRSSTSSSQSLNKPVASKTNSALKPKLSEKLAFDSNRRNSLIINSNDSKTARLGPDRFAKPTLNSTVKLTELSLGKGGQSKLTTTKPTSNLKVSK